MFVPPRPIPTPTEYFTVTSEQEMNLAPVIAINFMRYKFFVYFFGLNREIWIRHWIEI